MFRNFKVVFQKVHSFLFGEENEHIHTRQERKQYYGRIITDDDAKTKMIHQYPKGGKFRFPIINDQKTEVKLSPENSKENSTIKPTAVKKEYREMKQDRNQSQTQIKENSRSSSRNLKSTKKQPFEEREKFQGVNFKARNIPSPIYAFAKPPIKSKVKNVEEQLAEMESITKIVEAEQPSIIEKLEPQISDFLSAELNSLSVETEENSEFKEKLDEMETSIKPKLLEGWEEDIETTFLETPQFEHEVSATIQEEAGETEEVDDPDQQDLIGNNLEEVEVEEEVVVEDEELGVKEEKVEVDTLVEESQPVFAQELDELKVSSEDNNNLHSNHKKQLEHSYRSVNTIKNEAKVNKEAGSPKSKAPFNVLMLHKDRVAYKKTQEKQKQLQTYQFPTIQLLNIPPKQVGNSQQWLDEKKEILERTLGEFNVQAKVVGVTKGPSVTRFEILPEPGVKVSKITGLIDDIKLSLAAKDIRMEAPIPGRNRIGIEVPNDVSEPVVIREILRSSEFQNSLSPLTVAMGLDIGGKPIVTDIQKMPHGLIAGSTGSGKSVCINSILISILFKATPDEVKLMLIDPKMVELAPYNDIPHLVTPVITDAKQATIALKWAVEEMERRYELFVQTGVRDIERYNKVMKKTDDPVPALPFIVIVIDELADLMMVSPHDVEDAICRIAQKARACGIHLLVATQRPSVDVITGLIKANIPTRIAFSVSSQVDSRTIIDSNGAERLLGKGDMLLFENGSSKPVRVQGNFVSDEEIDRVIALVKGQRKANYLFDKDHLVKTYQAIDEEDDLFEEACYYVLEQGGASSSSLQRKFRIGFNRAARLIEMMEARGIISKAMGSKPRNILVSEEELSEQISN